MDYFEKRMHAREAHFKEAQTKAIAAMNAEFKDQPFEEAAPVLNLPPNSAPMGAMLDPNVQY